MSWKAVLNHDIFLSFIFNLFEKVNCNLVRCTETALGVTGPLPILTAEVVVVGFLMGLLRPHMMRDLLTTTER